MADLPDWFAASVIKGLYGTELKTIQVDELGRLYAILRALYGTTQKDVQCDASGNLTLNLKAQDLAEIINRPKYGAANGAVWSGDVFSPNTQDLFSITGKGIIYGGFIHIDATDTQEVSNVVLTIDGTEITSIEIGQLGSYFLITPSSYIFYLLVYDTTNFEYTIGYAPGITFESSLSAQYSCQSGIATLDARILYALV